MKTSLIITTYNRPGALRIVLLSVMRQTILPGEIIIADDGSDARTASLIEEFRRLTAVPVIHAWQEDLGFRAARVRNLAAARSDGEYLIFLDGDMILHPQFIASHLKHAKEGYYLHGKRAMLTHLTSERMIRKATSDVIPWLTPMTLRKHAFHVDALAGRFSFDSDDWFRTMSANFSVWKKDLLAINGFNEDFEGWGREDSELALRLFRHGVRKKELRFCAVTYHLAHGKDNKNKDLQSLERNQQRLDLIASSQIVRCENGISNHLPVSATEGISSL